jgi:CheY-like chemotaxis protein
MTSTRRPPKVLFIHGGVPAGEHIKHLTDAGLHVSDDDENEAVAKAVEWQPDIIVLHFSADGETTAQLKNHDATKQIPIIALAELTDDR